MHDNNDNIVCIINNHFQQKWTSQAQVENLDSSIIHPSITTIQNNFLTRPMTENEIEKVLQTMDPNKAPNLMSSLLSFFKNTSIVLSMM